MLTQNIVNTWSKYACWALFIIMIIGPMVSKGQDTIKIKQKKEKVLVPVNEPLKAAMLSALFPGGGQVYNEKYWKLPIVYGGVVTSAGMMKYFNIWYSRYRDALAYETDTDPSTSKTDAYYRFSAFTPENLRYRRDSNRRNRDLTVIVSAIWYGLSIADAAVDAHLKNFNVSSDLEASVYPSVWYIGDGGQMAAGLTLRMNFKNPGQRPFNFPSR